MNNAQLSAAIVHLLDAAGREVAMATTAEGHVWASHMTASKVTMYLAQALMAARDVELHPNDKI